MLWNHLQWIITYSIITSFFLVYCKEHNYPDGCFYLLYLKFSGFFCFCFPFPPMQQDYQFCRRCWTQQQRGTGWWPRWTWRPWRRPLSWKCSRIWTRGRRDKLSSTVRLRGSLASWKRYKPFWFLFSLPKSSHILWMEEMIRVLESREGWKCRLEVGWRLVSWCIKDRRHE